MLPMTNEPTIIIAGLFAGLRCPICGESNTIFLRLYDSRLYCDACENTVTRIQVTDMLNVWSMVLDWLDKMPRKEESGDNP